MKFQLGAMTVGEILDRSLQILVRRLPTFYALASIVLGPQVLLECLGPFILPTGSMSGGPDSPSGMEAVMGWELMALIGSLVTLTMLPIGISASVYIIAREYAGEPATLRDALGATMQHFVSLLASTIMTALLVGAVAFATCCPLACMAGFILAGVSGGGGKAPVNPDVQMMIVIPIVILSALPPLLIVAMYGFFGPAVVLEEKPAVEAMSRSKELGEGYFTRNLGVMFLLLVVWIGFRLVRELPFQLFLQPFEQLDEGRSILFHPGPFFLFLATNFILGVFPISFVMIVVTLLYFDLRVRKEGFDLELAMQQSSGGGIANLTGQGDEDDYEPERPRRRARRWEADEERPRRKAPKPVDPDEPPSSQPPPSTTPEDAPPWFRYEVRETPPEPDPK